MLGRIVEEEGYSRRKCDNCVEKTCEMPIGRLIDGPGFSTTKTRNTLRSRMYRKIPDFMFLPTINFLRLMRRRQRIRYKRGSGWWLIDYDKYSLYAPRPRWIFSTLERFRKKFEVFYRINEGDVCVDVGACIGDTALPMLVEAGASGAVTAVEPMPANVKFLEKNLQSYPNSTIIQKAVSDIRGKKRFYLHNTPTGHSLESDAERKYGTISVECETLDEMLKGLEIDFCKIDVQGHESSLLRGQKKFFEHVDKLAIETHGRFEREKATYRDVLRIMSEKQFNVRFCIADGVVHCQRKPRSS
jgi:FkbM family methyltransferase